MEWLEYRIGDRLLDGGVLFEIVGRATNRFGGPVYRIAPLRGAAGETASRWHTPRRVGHRARVIDRAALSDLVHTFYDRVRADAELSPVFARRLDGVWPEHLDRMVSFWASVMLGEGSFLGRPMPKHQAIDEARPEHFVRWLALFDEALARGFDDATAAVLRERATTIARGLSTGMFGRPFDAAA